MKAVHVTSELCLMDREALALWTRRSVATIRAKCRVHSYDEIGRAMYDADEAAEILNKTRRRGPNKQKAA